MSSSSTQQNIFNDPYLFPFSPSEYIKKQSCPVSSHIGSSSFPILKVKHLMQFTWSLSSFCSFIHMNPWIVQAKGRDMCVNGSLCFSFSELPCETCSHKIRRYQTIKCLKCPESGILFPLYSGNEQQRKPRCKGVMDSSWDHLASAMWPEQVGGISMEDRGFWQKERLQPAAQETLSSALVSRPWPIL